jgi:hypothetical protein
MKGPMNNAMPDVGLVNRKSFEDLGKLLPQVLIYGSRQRLRKIRFSLRHYCVINTLFHVT